jgi:hypothetical protein
MKLIQPNCRVQFTPEDIDFILTVLQPSVKSRDSLLKLLADEDSRDIILDDERLFRTVLENPHCLRISTHFYFYILVRNVFRKSDLSERQLADYVAELLADFSRTENTELRLKKDSPPLTYYVDMLATLEQVDKTTAFYIRAYVGNQSLFMCGVFPERIRYRAQRCGAPDLRYYEEVGRSSFRVASNHRLAQTYELADIFDTLSERFGQTRRALNDLGERLLMLGD